MVSEAQAADRPGLQPGPPAPRPAWDRQGGAKRAKVLRAMADALEADMDRLSPCCRAKPARRSTTAVAEVREAADFCRYYAVLAERSSAAPNPEGPGRRDQHPGPAGRGVFVCISPWNFPLAIFTGQIAAALAAGNAVLAKPAEQTPLIAAEAVRLYHGRSGPRLLALLPGRGETVGAADRHRASTASPSPAAPTPPGASTRPLAAAPRPIVPFIAETGGLNGMFVDTTALREQVIDDVILSAFGSAGQRCSALRLLFLPKDSPTA
jgi:RHH-type proline utilization regulon transcriptional repressor/proline dehydrogenase/delta 1-pyrroline-5-carboxylate dehydrogenase